MIMKHIMKSLYIAVAALLLSSCVKDELYDTPHPSAGQLTVVTQWNDVSGEAQMPDSYILQIGDVSQTVSGITNVFENLLPQGEYTLTVHNVPEKATHSAGTIAINAAEPGYIEALPGYLFHTSRTFSISADTDMTLNVPMRQYTRRLELVLTVSEGDHSRIASATATLSGICGSIDMATATRSTEPHKAKTVLSKEGNRFLTAYHLLGITPETPQMLTVDIAFANGDTQRIESDLSETLASFHSDNSVVRLTGNLMLPVEGDFSATISGWKIVDAGNTDAH